MISIVNYGSGNLNAITNIYDQLKIDYEIAETVEDVLKAEKIILPGVGAFDYNMAKLNDSGIKEALDIAVLDKKVPVLGICLGLQIMVDSSEEGSGPGLGWIKGTVKKFNKDLIPVKPKLPHMGWNSIQVKARGELFEGVDVERGFYFIHNYFVDIEDKTNTLTTTEYGFEFVSGIQKENIFAVQFHPEKSHSNGMRLLKNFAELQC